LTQPQIIRLLLWAVLAAPGALLLQRYLSGAAFYGEVVHLSGQWALYMLLLALAVTPIRRLWPGRAWSGWLLRSRRYLGVASFAYAALHTAVYLQRKGDPGRVLAEALEPGLGTGWLALVLFVPLALSSNDFSVRRLRRGWKRLHRAVYPAAFLVMAHWLLTAFDRTIALCFLGLLVALLAPRFLRLVTQKPRSGAPLSR